ncbi:MAG: trypsin-like serine protease [Planktotalea sp.]|uniref:trypsin-like serine peptidase n=1 Tax=Planktotalea sp. TaxID=2029877 RepID=UPI003C7137E6
MAILHLAPLACFAGQSTSLTLLTQRLDSPNGYCSATLIAPDLVLTAAHCVLEPIHMNAMQPMR